MIHYSCPCSAKLEACGMALVEIHSLQALQRCTFGVKYHRSQLCERMTTNQVAVRNGTAHEIVHTVLKVPLKRCMD